jgi:hypothetical protein
MGIGGKTVLLNRDILKDNNLAYIPGEFGQLCVARTEVPVVLNVFCEVAEFPLRPEQSRANLQTPVYSIRKSGRRWYDRAEFYKNTS